MSAASSKLAEMIRATEAEIVRAEKMGLDFGSSVSTKLMAASLHSRLSELQERFAVEADKEELDICSYRIISDRNGRYPVSALTSALSEFQKFVSVLYESVTTDSPRRRSRLSANTLDRTTLDVAYSFAGSLGFMLTMPRDNVSVADSKLEAAVSAMFALAKADNSETVAEFAKRYGTAPVQIAHRWAKAHADAGLSVDIEWKSGNQIVHHALAQVSELQRLTDIIENAGETAVQSLELVGQLIAGNISSKSFILDVDGERISGKLHSDFGTSAGLDMSLGHVYRAVIRRETTRLFATNREKIINYLLVLNPIPKA
jgi:hypothetical protein